MQATAGCSLALLAAAFSHCWLLFSRGVGSFSRVLSAAALSLLATPLPRTAPPLSAGGSCRTVQIAAAPPTRPWPLPHGVGCSQMSTAAGILQQFNMATRYQHHAGGEKAVLLLDEGDCA